MSTIYTLLIPAAIILLISMPLIPVYRGISTGQKAKQSLIFNLCAFFGFAALMVILPIGQVAAFAAEPVAAAATAASSNGMGYIAAALATGMSTIGAGIAVAAAAPAAIGATSEDPKALGKALIFVALGEGVALYGLLISILIINRLG
ncbi:ATP synthase subunit C [Oscillospiraceae bacterium MB08-C2-2]|nr:ATP synthase subunit C [Oscillospiraceae bacterium MB08-C2-2]